MTLMERILHFLCYYLVLAICEKFGEVLLETGEILWIQTNNNDGLINQLSDKKRKRKSMISSICNFPQCKYPRHGQFQATCMTSVDNKVEKRYIISSWEPVPAGSNRPREMAKAPVASTPCSSFSMQTEPNWRNLPAFLRTILWRQNLERQKDLHKPGIICYFPCCTPTPPHPTPPHLIRKKHILI